MRGDNLSSLAALDGEASDGVMCMVTDIENSQKNTLTVPFSTTARSLLEEVALQFGYVSGSFDLRYTDSQGTQHLLGDLGHRPLSDVCSSWAKKSKKNQFFVLHSHDRDLPSSVSDAQPNIPLTLLGAASDTVNPHTHNGTRHADDVTAEGSDDNNASDGSGDAVDNIRTLYNESADNQVNVNVDGYGHVPLGPVAPRPPPPPDYNSAVSSSRYIEGGYNSLPKSETGFVGLVNQAMTCYLNSLLQTLFMTPEFRNTLYSWEFDYKDDETRSIPFQLQKLFLTLQTSNKRAVETTAVTKSFGWDGSEVWQQHDVQELCHVMFDALEEKWKGTGHSDVINSLYRGRMKDYVKCLQCNNESARSVLYLDISLAIKPFGSSRAFESVEEALQAFVEPETLQGNDQYFCEKCNKKCDAHKGLKFISFPYLLTLQLKRFDFDATSYQRIKLNDRMTFPDMLDLSSFVQPEPVDSSPSSSNNDSREAGDSVTDVLAATELSCDASSSSVITPTAAEAAAAMVATGRADANDRMQCHQSPRALPLGVSLAGDVVCPSTAVTGAQLSPDGRCKSASSSCRAADDEGIDVSCSSSTVSLKGDSSSEAPSSEQSFVQIKHDVEQSEEPWSYELFSVMVHSGNAMGGHYYAYIKSFADNEFYSFNDQVVSKVTLEDVMRSYGGSAYGMRSSYSAANAYMLMYRRIDKKRNECFTAGLPRHIEELQQRMKAADEHDELQRELSRNTCHLRLFCNAIVPPGGAIVGSLVDEPCSASALPSPGAFVTCRPSATMRRAFTEVASAKHRAEYKLDVHKDKSLREATDAAYELLGLGKQGVSRDCVRLVQYDETSDVIEKSYEEPDDTCVSKVFGGVRSTYRFSLLLETKQPADSFLAFVPGGLMLKVYIVDAVESRVRPAISVSATLRTTVKELYSSIAMRTSEWLAPASEVKIRGLCVQSDSIIHGFLNEEATLQDEGFCKGSLVFVEEVAAGSCGPETERTCQASTSQPMRESRLYHIVETLICTVTLEIGLPSEQALHAALARERRHEWLRCHEGELERRQAETAALQALAEAEEKEKAATGTSVSAATSEGTDGSSVAAAEAASRPLLQVAQVTAYECCGGAEPVCTSWRRHVEIYQKVTEGTQDRVAVVHVDKRLTVGEMKHALELFAGVPPGQLRLFRVFSSGQESECQARASDKVSTIHDDIVVLVAKIGKAPEKGEMRVKVFRLDLTGHAETMKGHLEVVVPHGMLVRTLQAIVADEINTSEPGSDLRSGGDSKHRLPVTADRCRLRKKSFVNPGLVLHASYKLGVDVPVFSNCELFVEVLDEPDSHRGKVDMAFFVQHWQPSKCELGPVQSLVLPVEAEFRDIVAKISAISGIPIGRVSIGKARGSFPGTTDMALVDIHSRISWQPCLTVEEAGGSGDGGSSDGAAGSSWSGCGSTLYVDDGCVLLYRDEQEKLLELTNERRIAIDLRDQKRLPPRSSTKHAKKEKALKFNTNSSSSTSSSSSTAAAAAVEP